MTVTSGTVSRRVATPQVGYSAPLSFGAPVGATFWEQYPTIGWFKKFCSTISLSFFPCLGQSILIFFVWAYKSLKVSLTITHIRKHLLALMG